MGKYFGTDGFRGEAGITLTADHAYKVGRSDVPAILKYTRNVYYIGNLEFAKLVPGEAHFYNLDGDEIEKQTTEIKWDAEAAEKGGFEHFMMKEIHEQPKAVQDTLNSVIKNGAIDLSSVEITEDEIKNFEQIYIVACGSAWHVGMAAQYVLEDIADIPVRVELASEFRYRKMPLNQKALVIVVSQSGETADTLAALRLAKEKGITTMAIVNGVAVDVNSLVSMNMWGLTPDFLDVLEEGFKEFFEKEVPGNPLKAEYLIPIFIGELLEQGKMSVKVLKTNDTWYGMTYHEDVAAVKGSFKEMLENGVYKADLFSDL
ncbi:Glucosamine--fructose-6-phosphate aminotransferase [isomerizing] [uncultured Coprococcus sp.]|nr:SIS domain-containing protein [uncultured Coprococcus sp.]SCH39654.1 Glucosamine--fructose-6-phosphate aminotransferase [isomerizing] [uncultured Coprococcus sp.]